MNETNKSKIGDNVRKLRLEMGLTQEELARLAGYKSRSTINKIENGEREVSLSMLPQLAAALKTTPSNLFGWTEESNIGEIIHSNIFLCPYYESLKEAFSDDSDSISTNYEPLILENPDIADRVISVLITDNSMYPKLEKGDKVTVLLNEKAISGKLVVCDFDGKIAVRKINFSDENTELICLNPEYENKCISMSDCDKLFIKGIIIQVTKSV